MRAARGIAPKCPRVHTSAVALSFQRYPFTATLHSIPSANQELNSSPPSAESVATELIDLLKRSFELSFELIDLLFNLLIKRSFELIDLLFNLLIKEDIRELLCNVR